MPLDGIFHPRVQCMPLPVGPTLIRLDNARKNVAKRLPRYHMVVWNNGTLHSRTEQSYISHLRSANIGTTARTEHVEGSSHGNCRAKRSNPSVLPFLETHTPGGSLCTPAVAAR
jgi:hypothetical protein